MQDTRHRQSRRSDRSRALKPMQSSERYQKEKANKTDGKEDVKTSFATHLGSSASAEKGLNPSGTATEGARMEKVTEGLL